MCNLTMKYPHEEEIAELKAEIERLRNVIEESNRSTQMYRRRLDDLDRQYSKHKNEWYKADHGQRAEIERLKEEHANFQFKAANELNHASDVIDDLIKAHRFYQSRAAAWKRCAKRWHSGLMWLADCNGFFDEREFSLMKKNCEFINIKKAPPDWRETWARKWLNKLSPSPEGKSALDKKPDSSES